MDKEKPYGTMPHQKYYMTAEEFFRNLEAAVRNAYFQGDEWNGHKWHPEDLAVNIEASLAVLRGFFASAIWNEAAASKGKK